MTRFRLSLGRAPVDEPVLARRPFDLLCLTMACVLVVHAMHLPWWLTLVLAAVLAGRWRQRRSGGRNAPIWRGAPSGIWAGRNGPGTGSPWSSTRTT